MRDPDADAAQAQSDAVGQYDAADGRLARAGIMYTRQRPRRRYRHVDARVSRRQGRAGCAVATEPVSACVQKTPVNKGPVWIRAIWFVAGRPPMSCAYADHTLRMCRTRRSRRAPGRVDGRVLGSSPSGQALPGDRESDEAMEGAGDASRRKHGPRDQGTPRDQGPGRRIPGITSESCSENSGPSGLIPSATRSA